MTEPNKHESYSIDDIAKLLLYRESMTLKKLQNLMYYTEAWYQALYEQNLIKDVEFEAWVNGPIIRQLQDKYEKHGWNLIPKPHISEIEHIILNDIASDLIESIWITYGVYDGIHLMVLAQQEPPHRNARSGIEGFEPSRNIICVNDMRKYYNKIYIGNEKQDI